MEPRVAGLEPGLKERDVVSQILDYLAAEHIFAFRLNTGMFFFGRRPQRRVFRAHSLGPGAADILAFPMPLPPLWIECKVLRRKQTEKQKVFQELVEGWGHIYVVAYSIDDLTERLNARR